MVLKMKYSMSNMGLALGFLTVSIFSSLISTALGGDSIRAGLTFSIVIFFVLAMLLTPPDIFSQLFLAIPMWMLFEIGLLISRDKKD